MKRAAILFCLVVATAVLAAASGEAGGAGAALPSFFVYECPRPLNWDVVHDISSRFILSDCSGTPLQFIQCNKMQINLCSINSIDCGHLCKARPGSRRQ